MGMPAMIRTRPVLLGCFLFFILLSVRDFAQSGNSERDQSGNHDRDSDSRKVGPQGPAGPPGAIGPQGPPGPASTPADDIANPCFVDDFISGGSQLAEFENPGFNSSGNVGTIGALGWSTNLLAVPTIQFGVPGVISLGGSGSLTSYNHLRLFPSINIGNLPFNLTLMPMRTKWIVRALSIESKVRVGFVDDVMGATPLNGAYFETRLGEWWAVTKDGGFTTEFDTGVPVLFDARYQLLEIRAGSPPAFIEFFINGVSRASTPNTPSVGLNLVLQAGGNTGVLADYASLCFNGLQRNLQ
jgi:hypothetical protein